MTLIDKLKHPRRVQNTRLDTFKTEATYINDDNDNDNLEQNTNNNDVPNQKQKPESHKVALRRNVNASFFYQLAIHTISIFTTATVLQLTFRTIYRSDDATWTRHWYTLNLDQAEEANLLQLLAKVHELFMVTSLYAVVLHAARRMLVGRHGMPFGLLVGGYQLSSSVLIGRSIWAPLWYSFLRRRWRNAAFAVCLVLAVFFANTLGPASAVAMIPSLGWWRFADPFVGNHFPAYIVPTTTGDLDNTSPVDRLYPLTVDASLTADPEGCSNSSASFFCPGGGMESVQYWAQTFAVNKMNIDTNVDPSQSLLASYFRALTSWPTQEGSYPISHCTLLHLLVGSLISTFSNYALGYSGPKVDADRMRFSASNSTPVSSAVVRTQCLPFDYDTGRMSEDTPMFPTAWLSADENLEWPVPQETWNFTRLLNTTSVTWVEIPNTDPELGKLASIGAVVTIPYTVNTTQNGTQVPLQKSLVSPCLIQGQWAKSQITVDVKYKPEIANNLLDNDFTLRLGNDMYPANRTELGLSDVISIKEDWARLLNTPGWNSTDQFGNAYLENAIAANLNWFVSNQAHGNETYRGIVMPWEGLTEPEQGMERIIDAGAIISKVLSVTTTVGLSRVGIDTSEMFMLLNDQDPDDLKALRVGWQYSQDFFGLGTVFNARRAMLDSRNAVAVNFEFERFGWGYGFRGASTLVFAVVMLIIHAAIVLLFVIYLAAFRWCGRGFLSSAWDDMGDLVALALSSREAQIGHVGAGVKRAATWNLDVRIRERTYVYDKLDVIVGSMESVEQASKGLPFVGKRYR